MTVPGPRSHGPLRWLPAALFALLVMVTVGLGLVWWWGGRAAPPLPVLGEVPPFSLVDSHGAPVRAADLAGAPWIVDLVFTRCQLACPRMTEKLAALGPRLPGGVRRVSVSVDPTHDTPAVLAEYARLHHAEAPNWLFLTGEEAEMRRLAVEGLKLGVAPAPADDPRAALEPVTHSTRFVLVDGAGRIRGYYDGLEEGALSRLVRDATRLAAGRDGA